MSLIIATKIVLKNGKQIYNIIEKSYVFTITFAVPLLKYC